MKILFEMTVPDGTDAEGLATVVVKAVDEFVNPKENHLTEDNPLDKPKSSILDIVGDLGIDLNSIPSEAMFVAEVMTNGSEEPEPPIPSANPFEMSDEDKERQAMLERDRKLARAKLKAIMEVEFSTPPNFELLTIQLKAAEALLNAY